MSTNDLSYECRFKIFYDQQYISFSATLRNKVLGQIYRTSLNEMTGDLKSLQNYFSVK